MIHVELVHDQISMAVLDELKDPAVGAISIFLGTARNDDGCFKLEYTGYDKMALKELNRIGQEIKEKYHLNAESLIEAQFLLFGQFGA